MLFPLLQVLICAVAPMTLAADPARPVVPTVELAALQTHPAQYLGQRVRFYVQVDTETPTWNPYSTRFGPESYRCFRGWSEGQRLWDAKDYYRPAGRFFVPFGGTAARRLIKGNRFQRFLVVGTVRQVLVGQPWVEIDRVYKARRTTPEGTLLHARRGLDLLKKGAMEMARGEFQRALVPTLPMEVRGDIERYIQECDESTVVSALDRN